MDNVEGLEGFLKEFLPWYREFLVEVESHNLKDRESPAYTSRETVRGKVPYVLVEDGDCQFGAYGEQDVSKGTFVPLLEKEEELEGKVSELKSQYCVEVVPHFRSISYSGFPQYDLFMHGLEFSIGNKENKLYVGMKFELGDGFSPRYELDEEVYLISVGNVAIPDDGKMKNAVWRENKGKYVGGDWTLCYEEGPTADGMFDWGDDNLFEFHVMSGPLDDPTRSHPVLDSTISFDEEDLGNNALTCFLSLLVE